MAEQAQGWVEVAVEADADSVESVSEMLARFGYNQGVAIEEPYRQDEDGDNLEIDASRPVIVRTWLNVDASLAERKAALEEGLYFLQRLGNVSTPTYTDVAEADWANQWKEHFHILRIGQHFVVRPSWREFSPAADDLVIHLDPGMAFGTGLHPSTELCMLMLESSAVVGKPVLDVGAGSGILSIAAMRMGATGAVAVEIDSVAVKSLRENVSLNDMSGQIEIIDGDIKQALSSERKFPIVLANMIARILADNAPTIAQHVAPGGQIIASGIIEEREQLVIDAFRIHGFAVTERQQMRDWVALRFGPASA